MRYEFYQLLNSFIDKKITMDEFYPQFSSLYSNGLKEVKKIKTAFQKE